MQEEGSGGAGWGGGHKQRNALVGVIVKRLSGSEIYCPVGTVKMEQHTSRRIHLGRLFYTGC